MRPTAREVAGLCALVARRLGLRIPAERLEDAKRAVEDVASAIPGVSFAERLAWLDGLPDDGPAWGRLAALLTVGETYFFRDEDLFGTLERDILPAMLCARRAAGHRRLRVWSAGCSTGEEPYSLAIVLDRLLPDRAEWALTLLATDVSAAALAAAVAGRYREWSFRATPSAVRERYFQARPGGVNEVDAGIRRMVAFAPLNLAAPTYPSLLTNTVAMDLVLCRNVLMYLEPETQSQVAGRLVQSLAPAGILIPSPTEASADLFHPLIPVSRGGALWFEKGSEGEKAPAPVSSPSVAPRPQATRWRATPTGDSLRVPAPASPLTLDEAQRLADDGRLEDARRLCARVIARDPLDAAAHLLEAAISQEMGLIGAALAALRRATYVRPDCAAAHFLTGVLLVRSGAQHRGRRALATALRILQGTPAAEIVEGSGGLTAARLADTVSQHLEVAR